MRKGYTLINVMIIVFVLPFMILILDGLFKTLIKDIPRSFKVIQVNTSLLSMLKEMRQDIDKAEGLPQTYNQYTSGDNTLLINLPEDIICYQKKDDKVFRISLIDNNKSKAAETQHWPVPHAVIKWKVWRRDSSGYAVEIRTHIEHEVQGHLEKKMANSYLYFAGAL
jgi:hypothetical protein